MRHVGSVLFVCLSLSAAACGKVQSFTDGGGDDTQDDGSVLDSAQSGTVTVTTYNRCCTGESGTVVAGVDIVVVHADGSVGDTAVTSAAGEATLDVVAGDSVTAVYRDVSGGALATFVAVKPGDHLQFGEDFSNSGSQTGTMTVSWPVQPASQFTVTHPCGQEYTSGTALNVTLYQYSDCATTPFDALVIANDVADSSVIARWGLLADVPWTNGGNASLSAWQSPSNFTLTATGIPGLVGNASLEVAPMIGARQGPRASLSGTPTGGSLSGTRTWATGGDGIVATAFFQRPGLFGPQAVLEPVAANSTQWVIDDPVQLPWMGQVISNAAAREVTWISDGAGSYDTTLMFVRWSHYGTDGGFFDYEWTFILPAGIDGFQLPELPGTLMPYLPEDDDSLYVSGGLLDIAADPTYDDIRVRPEWVLTQIGADASVGVIRVSISPFLDRRTDGRIHPMIPVDRQPAALVAQ